MDDCEKKFQNFFKFKLKIKFKKKKNLYGDPIVSSFVILLREIYTQKQPFPKKNLTTRVYQQ